MAINTTFLALDLASYGASPAVVGGRLLVSAALLHGWWMAGRWPAAAWLPRALTLDAALLTAGMGALAAGTGGPASPYHFFVPVIPVVLGIFVPDEPGPPLAAGAVGLLVGLLAQPPGTPAGQVAFLVTAHGACTFYGWVAARLYRRLRERERAAAEARAQAQAALHDSEARRALAERLASLGRLAAGVAHEINNPLAFVSTNVAFVEEELAARREPEGELRDALRESRGGLERIKRIVQELRGFARGDAGGPGPTDALAALAEARRTLGPRLPRLELRAPSDPPPVVANQAELVQVLLNLLANAADAVAPAEAGGSPGWVEVVIEVVADGLEVAVCDSGPGFTPEALDHLGEPFFTTKGVGGTGLGLALSREFVERWGGRLVATNRPEGGARVVVVLRRADPRAGPAGA
ncbi:MAG: hypothetical protein IPO09_14545 [Anaeromyxobacter sp.]|nr:hypothetical protein [Anaeromyxobacter sp.]MBL0275401.1 hypothetical protein [Anaeromyxobacter sp.]